MNQTYEVKLAAFEGPLDLLLHLVNQYEVDIYDIPMAELTKQYMEFIHAMQFLELNIASEYLVMASTLVAIKSQMLLPKQEVYDDTEEYEEDLRDELLQRLIEYRKYKKAALKLKEKEEEAKSIFTRPPSLFKEEQQEEKAVTQGDVSVYDMLNALGKMFQRRQWNKPLDTKVSRAEIPIGERMKDVLAIVRKSENGIAFDELFPYPSKTHIVVTFIAILELMKAREVYCKQKQHFDTLYVFSMEE